MTRADKILEKLEEVDNETIIEDFVIELLEDEQDDVLAEVFEYIEEEGGILNAFPDNHEELEEVFKWIIRGGKKIKKIIRRIPAAVKAKLSRIAKKAALKRKGKPLKAATKAKIKKGKKKRTALGLK